MTTIRSLLLAVAALAVTAPAAPGQSLSGSDHYARLGQARTAFDQKRFGEAADLYRQLATGYPRDGELWLAYSMAADAAGRLEEAVAAAEKVVELGAGYRPGASIKPVSLDLADRPNAAYWIATGHARLGHPQQALDWLDRALRWQFTPRTMMQTDSAFASLRDDPRFRQLSGLPPKGPKPTQDARWRYDIDFLAAEAKRLHASFNREAFSPAFDAAVRTLKARVRGYGDDRIQVELQRIIALLHDGHSIVRPFGDGHWLPFQFYWFSDGLFVIDADAGARQWIGSQVLRIGAVDAATLKARSAEFVPRDNPMGLEWVGPIFLIQLDFLRAMGAVGDSSTASLTLKDRQGIERTVTVTGGPPRFELKLGPAFGDTAKAPLYLKRVPVGLERGSGQGAGRPTFYWFTAMPDARAVYAQFNQVIDQPDGESISQFAARLRDALSDSSVRNLIVDVRHNNGGNSYLYPPLLRVFSWFEESAPDRRIYFLAGRNTFSAAQNFSTSVERLTRAVFAGEPTGASPKFTGEGAIWFELPYSRLKASISNWYHQFTFWSDTRWWIAPEIPVDLSSTDYFAGRDPALEAVLAVIRQGHP